MEYSEAFWRDCRPDLEMQIEVDDSNLLALLVKEDLISPQKRKAVESVLGTQAKRVAKLLDFLQQRNNVVEPFLKALVDSDQHHVVGNLDKRYQPKKD